jgi:glycosyltransferase involved in cell wall biosynthesis
MRFYQAQADIVVEQLRYGWWGSTGVETMALGKPIVCYLRPSWKEFFFQNFPEYEKLPVIEATVDTIYDSLKLLVENEDFRIRMGEESRSFAEKHFNPRVNALSLERHLLDIH